MRKILDQKFWSQGTPLGYLRAHLAPYNGVRKFLFGDFKHLWDGLHYHASHCSGEFHDSQRCFGSYVQCSSTEATKSAWADESVTVVIQGENYRFFGLCFQCTEMWFTQ